jgi:hypothetical protein
MENSIPKDSIDGLQQKIFQAKVAFQQNCFSKAECADLVDSLGQNIENWKTLNAISYSTVARVFLYTERCIAQAEGISRLFFALKTTQSVPLPAKLELKFKNTIGQEVMEMLLEFFLDQEKSNISRRWVGMVMLELLDTRENKKKLESILVNTQFRTKFGMMIEEGLLKILKIVAGQLISVLVMDCIDEPDVKKKLLAVVPENVVNSSQLENPGEFPIGIGSQWESKFNQFMSRLEEDREHKGLW